MGNLTGRMPTRGNILNIPDLTVVRETIPTDSTKLNPSMVLAYDGTGNLTTITKTINSVQYRKTLTYDGTGNLTDVSVWSVV